MDPPPRLLGTVAGTIEDLIQGLWKERCPRMVIMTLVKTRQKEHQSSHQRAGSHRRGLTKRGEGGNHDRRTGTGSTSREGWLSWLGMKHIAFVDWTDILFLIRHFLSKQPRFRSMKLQCATVRYCRNKFWTIPSYLVRQPLACPPTGRYQLKLDVV